MLDIYILLVGILSGILGTLLGLGGGTFTIPILIFILKFDIHIAISLSLISIIAKSVLSSAINIKESYVNIPLGLMLTPSAIIGSTIGGRIGLVSSEMFLSLIFACTLLLTSGLVYLKRNPNLFYTPNHYLSYQYYDENNLIEYTPKRLTLGVIICSLGGFLGGAAGLGGGGILVPVMKVINGIPMKAATATSIFIMGFASIPPTLLYYTKGILPPKYAIFIIMGSFIGAIIGNQLTKKIKDKYIAKIFSATLILIAISMFIKAFQGNG